MVLPTWDQKTGDAADLAAVTLRRLKGAPSFVLTDKARTVINDRVAGVPIRRPGVVAACRQLSRGVGDVRSG